MTVSQYFIFDTVLIKSRRCKSSKLFQFCYFFSIKIITDENVVGCRIYDTRNWIEYSDCGGLFVGYYYPPIPFMLAKHISKKLTFIYAVQSRSSSMMKIVLIFSLWTLIQECLWILIMVVLWLRFVRKYHLSAFCFMLPCYMYLLSGLLFSIGGGGFFRTARSDAW